MRQQAQFWVDGLDCSDEILLLRRELANRPGIDDLEFDILNARMIVTFDPGTTSVSQIIEHVSRTSLTARPWQERNQPRPQSWWSRHGRTLLTGLAGGLLLAGFFSHALIAESFLAALGREVEDQVIDVPLVARMLYLASIVTGLWFVAPKAWAAVRLLRPDMNLLMSVAVCGALLIDEWFEAAMVTFLFAISLLLEHWSMERTRRAITSLMKLSPATARCRNRQTGEVEEHPVEDVGVGTTVLVRPGEKVPLDGRVLKGASTVNEAPITGESIPVEKQPGSDVFAGTINQEGALEFETTCPPGDTTLARIVHLVQEAQARRAPSEQWVETFARYYTPAMMIVALAIAVVPPLLNFGEWNDWTYRGLVVLVIACPCALVISTPVSIVSALAAAAHQGVLVKGGRFLEACAHLQALAIDKTGTLTYGRPVVQQIVAFQGHTTEEVLERAAGMETHSQHPLARAILRRADEAGITVTHAEDYRLLSGRGAEGIFAGKPFWIGSHRLMHERGTETAEIHDKALELEDAGHSVVAVGNADHVCGLISVADDVREGVSETIAALKHMGIRYTIMLTGDNLKTAQEVARVTGIDSFRSELLPEEKVEEIEALRQQFHSVGMIGDGVNDAPAMAASSLGIAMGAMGTDTAIETADVALMSDDLSKIPWLISHARRTLSIIKQNIAFALGLKCLFVILAFTGMASLWMAIAADTGASLLVIFNGLRLLRA